MAVQTEGSYADLVDLILTIGREIKARGYGDPTTVRLNSTEVTVMRYVDRHPGAAPSAVADATGLQRSNLSKALRGLEAKGLVQRLVDASDNRQATLHPTSLAAENLQRLRRGWARLIAEGLGEHARHHDVSAVLELLHDLDAGLAATRRTSHQSLTQE